ncbi:benzoate/H(+) symporter BenE family transporter [Salinarimonas chemoclinalis]|uniref:benzoate/H(+) symporter BenE family transporter n=1 Tax=Salinarimonas chemoclinalis TaxID=3241599 RepID=UPI0035572FEF
MSDMAGGTGTAEARAPAEGGGGPIQPVSAGALAALVGFASTFALLLQGFVAVGATPAQAASGLLAVCLVKGVLAIGLSWRTRLPISIAWSTPGAALLVATGAYPGGFPVAVGAFLAASVLVILAGVIRPFGRAVERIPMPLAAAMLAGILLDLCLAPARATLVEPALALPIVVVWASALRFARPYAVPLAVLVTIGLVFAATPLPEASWAALAPRPVLVAPTFSLDALVGLALPLFLVTMASQNVPGLAVLAANGYRPPVGPVFVGTGVASAIAAPFGGHLVNLAAITAALCAGPEAHPDPAKRWVAAATAGAVYVALGLSAGAAAAFIAASPPILIQAVAGLALLTSFAGAIQAALADEKARMAALVCFVTTASGVAFFGIGAPFWGLLAGGAMWMLRR